MASNTEQFAKSFIGTRLIIDNKNWTITNFYDGDTNAEEDCWFILSDGKNNIEIHYEDYDEGQIFSPEDYYLDGKLIEYPDGEPPSVSIRREEQKKEEQ